MLQDALYLREYARALSLAGVRSPGESALVMVNEHSSDAITVERSLHEGFLKDLSVARDEAEGTEMFHHPRLHQLPPQGGHFRRLSRGLGAVLPCYWIYREVGKALLERSSPNPLYQRWIDTYGGEEFGELVEAVLDLANNVFEDLTPTQKARVTEAFATTSRYEWMFWDAGWRLEGWPVG